MLKGPQPHGRAQPDGDGPRPPNNRVQQNPAHQPPAPAGPAGGRPAEAAPVAHGVAAGLPRLGLARPRGLLQEIQALVVGFFTSLMPGAGLTFSVAPGVPLIIASYLWSHNWLAQNSKRRSDMLSVCGQDRARFHCRLERRPRGCCCICCCSTSCGCRTGKRG